MAQPPDLEHKRKRDAEDYGQTASSQPIVPQQQQGQGAFFLPVQDCAPPSQPCVPTTPVRLHRSWQIQWARLDRARVLSIMAHRQICMASRTVADFFGKSAGQVNTGFINYLSRSTAENLTLLPSEPETFTDIIRTLSGYEGTFPGDATRRKRKMDKN